MKKQRGQSLVEFALILPMFALFLFGLIYGGIMFRDFLDFSNEARAVARQIAVASDTAATTSALSDRKQLISNWTNAAERDYGIYKVKLLPTEDDDDVLVTVTFTMTDDAGLPRVLANNFDFPPKTFTLKYRMKLE